MADVRLEGVKKRFGDVEIIKGVDLAVEDGRFCVFVGPSGCGKSTLLRLIAGLENVSEGRVTIGGRDMTSVPPANRGTAMVFQSYALYPHMTVAENISFGLRMAKAPKDEIERRVARAAGMLQLDHLLQRKPAQLSGGQRQRVAIGRAIVREPGVFLFDEPLSNLDASLRVQMRIEIGKLHQDLGATMIYVTHDQVEAMTLADQIVVLSAGRIEQVGSPLELYHRPRNLFVAKFIGSPTMNTLPVEVLGQDAGGLKLALPGGKPILLPQAPGLSGSTPTLGVRPEHLTLGEGRDATLNGKVRLTERLGSETMLYVDLGHEAEVVVRADGLSRVRPGDVVPVGLSKESCHVFDAGGNAVLNGALM
ncbi:MAG TPA: sn-glycerol-3-phosphate ABC transporter ATP-binding protein UgpC [Microvirga sp.]|jgi:multiple sugar transport system ATP-binding protein|nr:sn-glycerol-3-phosphate ABC transporter ATP-binding protein UgpC [Microvirga sp.]